MTRRIRLLLTAMVALVVVAVMVGADVVTLTKAKPSFDNETRAFNRLLPASPTTTLPTHPHPHSHADSWPSPAGLPQPTGSLSAQSARSTPSTPFVPSAPSAPSVQTAPTRTYSAPPASTHSAPSG